jgi:diguanylate cyclase (GGDEF)-like protein
LEVTTMYEQILHLNIQDLECLSDFSPFCKIVFNREGIIFKDKDCIDCLDLIEHIIAHNFDSFESKLSPRHMRIEYDFVNRNQETMWYEVVACKVIYNDSEVILSHVINITEKKRAEHELNRISKVRSLMLEVSRAIANNDEIEVFYSLILKNALAAIEKSHLGSIFIRREDHFHCISYIGFDESVMDFQLPVKHSFLYRATDGAMDQITYLSDIQPSDLNYPIKLSSKEEAYIKSSLSAPIIISGEIYGMVNIDSLEANAFDESDVKSMAFMRDNIEIAIINHLLFQEKSHLAKYDRLTGLYNRHFFEDQYEFIKEKAQRYSETFNLVMFDVDELKKINDLYGHFVGDQVIRKIALEMQTSSRKSDVIARFGGDEIIAILFVSDAELLNIKFTKLQEKLLDNPISFFEEKIQCSFSFGVASFPQEGQEFEELLKIADARMYINKAKRSR